MLNERVSSLFEFTGRGQQLQRDVPSTFATNEEDEIADWILKAKDWSEDTNAYLARYSGRASASFSLVVTSTAADSVVHTPTSSFPVTGRLREHYQKLLVQLDNLRRIMEKPDAYF